MLIGTENGLVQFWDIETESLEKTITVSDSVISYIDITPDNNTLVVLSGHEVISTWDLSTETETPLLEFVPDFGSISTLQLAPLGKEIAIGNGSGQVALWDLTTGNRIRSFYGLFQRSIHKVKSLSFSPDGKYLVGVGGCQLHVWFADYNDLIDYACDRLFMDTSSEPTCPRFDDES